MAGISSRVLRLQGPIVVHAGRGKALALAMAAACCFGMGVSRTACAGDENANLRKAIAGALKDAAVAQLDAPILIQTDEFNGSVEADNPRKKLDVELPKLKFPGGDVIECTLDVTCPFKVSGDLKQVDNSVTIRARADVSVSVDTSSKLVEREGDFFLESSINDVELTLTLSKLEPADLGGGTELINKLIKRVFANRKKTLIEHLNKTFKETKLEL